MLGELKERNFNSIIALDALQKASRKMDVAFASWLADAILRCRLLPLLTLNPKPSDAILTLNPLTLLTLNPKPSDAILSCSLNPKPSDAKTLNPKPSDAILSCSLKP